MKTHILKVEHEYMDALQSGEKTFEVRHDDRGFQKGDKLTLCRYGRDRSGGSVNQYGFLNSAGRVVSSYPMSGSVDRVERRITYILTGGQFGIEAGYVVLGLKK